MTEYLVPASDAAAEFTEKRSRFIGHVWRVESEEAARAKIAGMKREHHDARHNCWCYILHDGGVVRYSDDGEPQGTAGLPMLEVFRRAGLEDVCCVVTRYFGGILLGAGGLLRAYTRGAVMALEAAGTARLCPWTRVRLTCPYPLLERVKLDIEAAGGVPEDMEYGEAVQICAMFPAERVAEFSARVVELSAGGIQTELLGTILRPAPN